MALVHTRDVSACILSVYTCPTLLPQRLCTTYLLIICSSSRRYLVTDPQVTVSTADASAGAQTPPPQPNGPRLRFNLGNIRFCGAYPDVSRASSTLPPQSRHEMQRIIIRQSTCPSLPATCVILPAQLICHSYPLDVRFNQKAGHSAATPPAAR